jgi:ribonuclease R
VAHFVSPDSPLDREAAERTTSAYFPGYVVPMLPEVLSNGLCSLKPGEDRLTRSAFIRYDAAGQVTGARFARSVIRSAARLVYEDVSAALEGQPGRVPPDVLELLERAERLAKRIRARRLRDGMLSLNLPEVYITLDADGQVRDAGPADTSYSHTMIEMFMVEANEAVCRALAERGLPHLRRVHPEPDPDGLDRLKHLLGLIGITPPTGDDRPALQKLVDRVRGTPAETLVNYLLLRSFAPAEYSPAGDIGHYALASEHYCHFTSPIRRYPDINVHRTLDVLLDGGDFEGPDDDELAVIGRACTDAERRAEQAEREAQQWLLLELMAGKLGESFDALVTGVVPAGVFVQVQPHMAEGFIRVDDFGPDEWEFDQDGMRFIAAYAGRTLGLGQTCRVEVAAVDELRRELVLVPDPGADFGHPLHEGATPRRGTPRRRPDARPRRDSAGRAGRAGAAGKPRGRGSRGPKGRKRR